jgi:hypothetical protein
MTEVAVQVGRGLRGVQALRAAEAARSRRHGLPALRASSSSCAPIVRARLLPVSRRREHRAAGCTQRATRAGPGSDSDPPKPDPLVRAAVAG